MSTYSTTSATPFILPISGSFATDAAVATVDNFGLRITNINSNGGVAGVRGAVLSGDAGAPETGLFRLIFALLTAAAALACLSTLFIHRFPPESAAGTETSAIPDAPGSSSRDGSPGNVARAASTGLWGKARQSGRGMPS